MNIIDNPNKNDWEKICKRPTFDFSELKQVVEEIINEVKANGDDALIGFAEKFDSVKLDSLLIDENEACLIDEKLEKSIKTAYKNISTFHKSQITESLNVNINGAKLWRKSVAIESVGLYIPGGTAPLFSTVLMLAIPAMIAGCKNITLCTPPQKDGSIHPAILFTAKLCGITRIFKVGGAQAIAAMAYGTSSIPKCHKIFGPGNQFVTLAKQLISQEGIAIDMPAGPSELLVIADKSANPKFIAADLLSQAEHGADSQVFLVTTSEETAKETIENVLIQIEKLPRKDVAQKAIKNSRVIVLDNMESCIEFSNYYAPEHLIICTEESRELSNKVINAGSVFVGHYTPESAGDYASGTNHVLPTNGFATAWSGVSLDSFYKKITFQELNKESLLELKEAIEIMAKTEGLNAHKNAVSIRFKE